MNERVTGALIMLGCIFGIVAYGGMIFLTGWSMLLIQITAFFAVALILAIMAWIGYTMATTPPLPLDNVETEGDTKMAVVANIEHPTSEPRKDG